MDDEEWFTLAELTERLGGLVWVEEQVASLLAAWAEVDADPAARVHFFTTGRHHRWHAEVLLAGLATSPQLRDPDVVRSPTVGWTRTIDTLSGVRSPDATTARLKAFVKVIDPWLDREIGALVELARPVSDAAMLRWLRFVAIDHADDGDHAELLLAAHASDAVSFDEHLLVHDLSLG